MTAEISFSVESTNGSIPLGFQARLDGQVQFDTDHLQQLTVVKMTVDDNVEAEHILELTLKNKLPEHTQISDTGEIVADAVIKITDISFDQVPIGEIVFDQASYSHNFNGNGPDTQENFFGVMGCNGTVKLKFTTPVYLWFLENM
jgi:hypothetical protein